jgi:hypothetical protein
MSLYSHPIPTSARNPIKLQTKQTHIHLHIWANGLYRGSGTAKEIRLTKSHFEAKNTPPQTPKLKGHSKRQDRVSSEQTKSQRRR